MEPIKLDCTLEERISSKSGKPYKAIFIKLTPNLEKMVMPEKAETEVISMYYNQDIHNMSNSDFNPFN